ncbi:MAG: cation:proton antiporter [Dehalococcoidia bacterium]|nr:cation:proton antiporter [Dehalococcoidia bacterium]
MEDIALVKDFAVIMVTAGAVTLLFRKLNQPLIIGYLIGGILLGPYSLSFPGVGDPNTIRLLADLGLVLILFALGLEFGWGKIRQMGIAVMFIAVVESLTMICIGYGLGRLLGWGSKESLFLGAALVVTSTAIIGKTMKDAGESNRSFSPVVIGVSVVEDFIAVILIAVLAGMATTGTADLSDIGSLVFRLLIFLIVSLKLGPFIVRRIINYTHQFQSEEVLLIVSLGLCFGMAVIGDTLGLSAAAGAFIMGALIGDTQHSPAITKAVTPIKDMFAAIFFITIGMLVNIRDIKDFIIPTIAVFMVFVLGKILINTLATLMVGYKLKTSLEVGMRQPVMGELSLATAKVGADSGVVIAPLYPVIALVTGLTSFTGPYIAHSVTHVADFVDRKSPRLLRTYGYWVNEWGHILHVALTPRDELAQTLRHSVKIILTHLLVVALIIGTGSLTLQFIDTLSFLKNVRLDIIGICYTLFLLAVCMPSFVIIWRNTRIIVDESTKYILRRRRSPKGWRYETLHVVIRDTMLLALSIFIILWFVPLISDLLAIGSYALAIPVLFLAFLLFLTVRSVRNIHRKLAKMLSLARLENHSPAPPDPNTFEIPPEDDQMVDS